MHLPCYGGIKGVEGKQEAQHLKYIYHLLVLAKLQQSDVLRGRALARPSERSGRFEPLARYRVARFLDF